MNHFEDSVEATEFMDRLRIMLNDERLIEWIVSTDDNYATNSQPKLEKIQQMFEQIFDEMTTAG